MFDIILQEARALTVAEKRRLVEAIRALIADGLAGGGAAGEPARCPRCGSPGVTRKGHGADGRQRCVFANVGVDGTLSRFSTLRSWAC